MNNTQNIPATLTFTEPTRGLTADGKSVKLATHQEYKVLEVKSENKYNDYGYLVYTYLIIQRAGGKRVTVPWGEVQAVAC